MKRHVGDNGMGFKHLGTLIISGVVSSFILFFTSIFILKSYDLLPILYQYKLLFIPLIWMYIEIKDNW